MFSWIFPRFNREKYDVRLIGLRPPDAASEDLEKRGVKIHCLGKGKFDFSTVRVLARMIREESPDVLHLHGYGACTFGRLAAWGKPVKCLVHEHFVDPAMPTVQKPFDYLLAKRCDFGIAASKSVKAFMVNQRYLAEDRIRVVYYGTSLADFKPVAPELAAVERRRWGVPEGNKVIGFVGRIDTQKGLTYLLDAAASLLGPQPNLSFVIVGDGPLMGELKAQSEAKGIARNVVFAGHSSNVPLAMSAFDIQVFPSLWEGSPLALFEAMAMARPIVSTDVDGLGEVLRDQKTALLVPARNPVDLGRAIGQLLDRPELAAELARGALADSAKYDVQRTVDAMEQIYSELGAARMQGRN